ncbi:hypothetical protein Slala03_74350 [Streptomyces lavendulae subsp. lavendulae]|uniref:DUF5954 family protein n=1 Tax=Streptomyces lavendulae TaxID=1914 RepID=UPI0024A2CDEC|nr:DUF5954 family protein [Streptomyces lavendulae]GLV87746.1 hypothetical protein Slala03_74350 [Streptomyces lavendulae subsp. lavendulae]
MEQRDMGPGGARPVVVRVPVGPVEAVVEADAADAAKQLADLAVRGPLFGVAAQDVRGGPGWSVVRPVTAGCPQQARDSLNSLLWFRAKDEARDRQERCALLAAVARLEAERVDDLTVAGTRYRIVRAEEYAGSGPTGIEEPRPTDPEPAVPDWTRGARRAEIDAGLVLDPDAPVTPMQAAERLALRDLSYAGTRYPAMVLADSQRALETHPDVLLLPATFTVMEKTDRGWKPVSGPHVSAHDARRSLDFALTWAWPRMHGLIPFDADDTADARTLTAAGHAPGTAAGQLATCAEAADRLRAGLVNRLEVGDSVYLIGRVRRLVRWGTDGPEGPRPTDTNGHDPGRIHPVLDEDGNILPEEGDGEDEEAL